MIWGLGLKERDPCSLGAVGFVGHSRPKLVRTSNHMRLRSALVSILGTSAEHVE